MEDLEHSLGIDKNGHNIALGKNDIQRIKSQLFELGQPISTHGFEASEGRRHNVKDGDIEELSIYEYEN